jgi:hypothetical protein
MTCCIFSPKKFIDKKIVPNATGRHREMEGERERSSSYLIISESMILVFGLYVALPRQQIHKGVRTVYFKNKHANHSKTFYLKR